MKLKILVALGFFTLFGFVNQPFVPVPWRMTSYFFAYIPSILASGLTYWYYDNTIETKCTLLTTAAKSVIAWHGTLSSINYGKLTVISLWSTELEEYWNNNGNHSCITILPLIVGPTFLVSIAEFQVLRALFVFYPYEFLAFNHDCLAYPLAASVPTVSGIVLLISYLDSGGFCNKKFLEQFFLKLDIVINAENFIYPNLNIQFLFHFLILLVEFSIRLNNNWSVITETVRCPTCWWKSRNAINPSSDQPPAGPDFATYLDQYKVGPILLLILLFAFLQVIGLLKFNVISFQQAFYDCAAFGLPIYWIISSDEICDFIKLKYHQLKYRFGYY